MRPAVFVDRDGTLITQVHHLTSAAAVRVMPGVPAALGRLHGAGYALVVVTNQSVLGRGLLTPEGLDRIHDEMTGQIRTAGGPALDGLYACPEVPGQTDPTVVEHVDRKPGPGLLLRAARELELRLDRSWMIGDAPSDVLAGRNAGCLGSILVRTGYGAQHTGRRWADEHVADDLAAAAELILRRHAVDSSTPVENTHS